MAGESAWVKFWSPGRLLIVFTVVNLVNYVDRYVIAGMTSEIAVFVKNDLHTDDPDAWVGTTQSAFIGGYAVASLIFGHLVHRFHPFRLMAVGLMVWCGAVILTGAAPRVWIMILARVISGVGEASFQCIVPPYLDDQAPPEKRGLWLACFFMAIPVGAAMGFGYGGFMTSISAEGWRYAYFLEAILMAPFAIMIFFLPYSVRDDGDRSGVGASAIVPSDDPSNKSRARSVSHPPPHEDVDHKPGVMEELTSVLTSKMFLSTVLGYAAYTFVTSGFATWGAKFLTALDLFEDSPSGNLKASLTFGAIVSVTGAIGTPVGGLLLDKDQATYEASRLEALKAKGITSLSPDMEEKGSIVDKSMAATWQLFLFSTIGCVFCVIAAIFVKFGWPFYVCIFLGCLALFATTSATNLNVMSSVPPENRSFAIGMSTIGLHALGDVPSPPILGLLIDENSGAEGRVLVLLCSYLVWAVLFWGACNVMARNNRAKYISKLTNSLLADPDRQGA